MEISVNCRFFPESMVRLFTVEFPDYFMVFMGLQARRVKNNEDSATGRAQATLPAATPDAQAH